VPLPGEHNIYNISMPREAKVKLGVGWPAKGSVEEGRWEREPAHNRAHGRPISSRSNSHETPTNTEHRSTAKK
jgi:hypothetical protein